MRWSEIAQQYDGVRDHAQALRKSGQHENCKSARQASHLREHQKQDVPGDGGHDHQAGETSRSPDPAERDRAEQRTEGEAGHQVAEPGLIDMIDVLRDIRQQSLRERKRSQIEKESEPYEREQPRRVPDMSEYPPAHRARSTIPWQGPPRPEPMKFPGAMPPLRASGAPRGRRSP